MYSQLNDSALVGISPSFCIRLTKSFAGAVNSGYSSSSDGISIEHFMHIYASLPIVILRWVTELKMAINSSHKEKEAKERQIEFKQRDCSFFFSRLVVL